MPADSACAPPPRSAARDTRSGVTPARSQLFGIFVPQLVERERAAVGDLQRALRAPPARGQNSAAISSSGRRCRSALGKRCSASRRPSCPAASPSAPRAAAAGPASDNARRPPPPAAGRFAWKARSVAPVPPRHPARGTARPEDKQRSGKMSRRERAQWARGARGWESGWAEMLEIEVRGRRSLRTEY